MILQLLLLLWFAGTRVEMLPGEAPGKRPCSRTRCLSPDNTEQEDVLLPGAVLGDSQALRCKRTAEDDFHFGSKAAAAARAPRLKQLLPSAHSLHSLGHINSSQGGRRARKAKFIGFAVCRDPASLPELLPAI